MAAATKKTAAKGGKKTPPKKGGNRAPSKAKQQQIQERNSYATGIILCLVGVVLGVFIYTSATGIVGKAVNGFLSGVLGLGDVYKRQAKAVRNEIDVRGMTVEEAILDIDKFLDDAALAGLTEVSVIHGKGTGALRAGVQDYLRRNKHAKSFRLGRYGEGETGVTIVELR